MRKKLVSHKVDLANLPRLTAKQKAQLAAIAEATDKDIDFSDIPPLTEEFFKNALRGRFYKPVKQSTTVRIDADVLAWLRAQGKGYQSRINSILRREMMEAIGKVSTVQETDHFHEYPPHRRGNVKRRAPPK